MNVKLRVSTLSTVVEKQLEMTQLATSWLTKTIRARTARRSAEAYMVERFKWILCLCFVTRALVASGYKWGDLEDTRAALLVHTSKSWMSASPRAKFSSVRRTIDRTGQDMFL